MTYRDHVSTDTLADHAEGLLGESETALVDSHLAECDDCHATALLLASIPEILSADDVGPMPAHYASRIDVALAELYAAEPPIARPAPVAATPIHSGPIAVDPSSNVVDLSTRRKLALTGLRRVSTIAASMVLLIAGAALGIQTVGKDRSNAPSDVLREVALPEFTNQPSVLPNLKRPKVTRPGPGGSRVDPKTGVMYSKNKVRFPDGTVVTMKDNGDVVSILRPGERKATVPAAPRGQDPKAEPKVEQPSKGGDPGEAITRPRNEPATSGENPSRPQDSSRAGSPDGSAQDPASPGIQSEATTPPAQGPKTATVGKEDTAVPSDDPYVQESNQEYTEDNFAALVMDLVRAARLHSENQNDFGPSSTGTTPTPSSPSPAPSSSSEYRVPTAMPVAYNRTQAPQEAGRGPAAEKVQDRVRRCAEQLGTQAIAGDVGTWEDRTATIVVVPSANPNQVDGYVFYGNCSNKRPVTAQSAQWQQRVDKPARDAAPEPTPARRVGSVQPNVHSAQSSSRSQ